MSRSSRCLIRLAAIALSLAVLLSCSRGSAESSISQADLAEGVISSAEAADIVLAGIRAERFLILTHQQLATYWGKNAFKDNAETVAVVGLFVGLIGLFCITPIGAQEANQQTIAPEDNGQSLVNPQMGWTMHYYSNIISRR